MPESRPSWLQQIIATYGEPKITVNQPVSMLDEHENRYNRIGGWTWFPDPDRKNHSISIDHYEWPGLRWRVNISSHTNKPQLVCMLPSEPTDQIMVNLLQVTRFIEQNRDIAQLG